MKPTARRSAIALAQADPGAISRGRRAAFVLLLPLAGCSGGVLEPHGPVGAADRIIMLDALGIMLAVVVPTICALLGVRVVVPGGRTRGRADCRASSIPGVSNWWSGAFPLSSSCFLAA